MATVDLTKPVIKPALGLMGATVVEIVSCAPSFMGSGGHHALTPARRDVSTRTSPDAATRESL